MAVSRKGAKKISPNKKLQNAPPSAMFPQPRARQGIYLRLPAGFP
jgi:hypothetical protein